MGKEADRIRGVQDVVWDALQGVDNVESGELSRARVPYWAFKALRGSGRARLSRLMQGIVLGHIPMKEIDAFLMEWLGEDRGAVPDAGFIATMRSLLGVLVESHRDIKVCDYTGYELVYPSSKYFKGNYGLFMVTPRMLQHVLRNGISYSAEDLDRLERVDALGYSDLVCKDRQTLWIPIPDGKVTLRMLKATYGLLDRFHVGKGVIEINVCKEVVGQDDILDEAIDPGWLVMDLLGWRKGGLFTEVTRKFFNEPIPEHSSGRPQWRAATIAETLLASIVSRRLTGRSHCGVRALITGSRIKVEGFTHRLVLRDDNGRLDVELSAGERNWADQNVPIVLLPDGE